MAEIPQDFDFANYDPTNEDHRRFLKIVIDERSKFALDNAALRQEVAQAHNATTAAELEKQAALSNLAINDKLSKTLDHFGDTVAASSSSQIAVYKGNPRQLRSWIQSLEKFSIVTRGKLDDTELIKKALLFSEDAVSTFIQDTLKEFEKAQIILTWAILSRKLKDRFGLHLDLNSRIINLRKYAQRPSQSIQIFADALLREAKDIYEHDIVTKIAQNELVSIFAKGLTNSKVGRRVLDDLPATLEDAVKLAIDLEERQLRLKAHGFVHEPMDVSAVQTASGGARPKDMRSSGKRFPQRFNNYGNQQGHQQQQGQRSLKCYSCGGIGHFASACANNVGRQGYQGQQGQQRYQGRQGHHQGQRQERPSYPQGRPIKKSQEN